MQSTRRQTYLNTPEGTTSQKEAGSRIRLGKQAAIALAIFTLAFGARYYHNHTLEHRIWYLEDAQNYLRSGNAVLNAVRQGGNKSGVSGIIQYVREDAKGYSGIYNAFNSDKLVDRLLTDGPIFPIYLAATEAVLGLNEKKPDYEAISIKVTDANSIIDSSTCVLLFLMGSLFFGPLPGVLAGIIYAIYPGAIVNTQWCMSETFCSFMLVAAVYALGRFLILPSSSTLKRLASGTATGAVLGLAVLSKPAFPLALLFLGFAIAAASFWNKFSHSTDAPPKPSATLGRRVLPLVTIALSFLITVSPWLWYTQVALGKPSLSTNRLPAFNLVSGNLSTIDGWTPFPNSVAFPEDMKLACQMIADDAAKQPVDFALLQMKKLSRLWSGVWNDCKYSILGMNIGLQTLLHQTMLFLAFSWALVFVARSERSNNRSATMGTALLAGAIAFPFTYLAFIALDRYAFSAVPFVSLAAAATIASWVKKDRQTRNRLMTGIAAFAAVAFVTNEFRWLTPLANGFIPPGLSTLTPWLVSALAVIAFAGVCIFAGKTIWRSEEGVNDKEKRSPVALVTLLTVGFVLTACGIVGSIVGSRTWSEWKCPLTEHAVTQSIVIQAETGTLAPTGFLVVDLHDDQPLPRLQLELNGQTMKADLVPVAMLQTDNDAIVRSLAIQAKVSDQDYRAHRHWYAMPFPTSILKRGQANTIVLKNASPGKPITIFGDYITRSTADSDGVQVLPSINSLSWNYAVEASDWRLPVEARLNEPVRLKGLTTDSAIAKDGNINREDLSPLPGKQWGRYRVRLLVKPLLQKQLATQDPIVMRAPIEYNDSAVNIVYSQKANTEHTADGGNPMTFYLTDKALPIQETLLKNHLIKFTCQLKASKPANAFLNLIFRTGNDDVWTPFWQPNSIPVTDEWKRVTIVDSYPKLLLEHGGVSVTPMLMPFGDDLLFANKRKATKQKVQIKDARLELIPNNLGERTNLFGWTVL